MVNRVLVQASFSLFNLPLADIIDSDLQKHKRRYSSLHRVLNASQLTLSQGTISYGR